MRHFDKPLRAEKVIVPIKKKFLWLIPYNSSYSYWKILETFRFYFDNGDWIEVKAGFCTDYASTPRFAWILLPPEGNYTQAAVLHDLLYQRKGDLLPGEYGTKGVYTRAESDAAFCLAMDVLLVPLAAQESMHSALRIAGWWAWNHGKPANQP